MRRATEVALQTPNFHTTPTTNLTCPSPSTRGVFWGIGLNLAIRLRWSRVVTMSTRVYRRRLEVLSSITLTIRSIIQITSLTY
ncbi:hypothetical protein TNCV_2282261 [Trichonephila clavipes]|nr:hypothetical protein TNCV_2282261 [Trichonephila clavipes]